MKKIQYAVWKKETNNAGGKAKNDAFDIAEQLGFEASYYPSEKRAIRVLQQFFSLHRFDRADIVFLQYPAVDFRLLRAFIKRMDAGKKYIALVHDLRSIQGSGTEEDTAEIPLLNHFQYVIAHNEFMAAFLKENGCTSQIIELELFDYLHNTERPLQEPKGDGSVAFAGNLVKSTFVFELGTIPNVKFLLYGNKGNSDLPVSEPVIYKGSLPSDEIVYKLEGDYGLVWDGPSIESCSGKQGEYLRYNNPHKLSLYIAAGKPVVTWRKAAIAKFVKEHEIGILVDSLEELSEMDLSEQYTYMRQNILNLKKSIAEGYFLKTAIEKCIAE